MTFGTRAPSIVIPATADLWPDDRRRAVLLHELAHVVRYDCLTQTLALIACAAYWPHPAVWWVARQLRVERELACDDRVLAAGAEAHAYAGHLLDIAYSLEGRRAPALAMSMARPSQLEGRLLAALDDARNRRSPGLVVRLTLGAAASVAVVALAGATPIAIETAHRGRGVAEGVRAEPAPMVAARHVVESVGAAVSTAMQDNLPGTWELRPTTTPGMVHLRLVEGNNTHGTNVPLASLEGLTEAQLAGAGGPVQFRITRDAGTLQFDGVLRSGVAAGTFSFTPNPAFPAELVKRGFTTPTAREQYQLARADIGYAFLDELNRLGYAKPDTAGLVKAGQHGVNATYLREMGALGYALGSLPPLITLRDHGVTPDYVRGMAQEGYAKLPADTLRQARDHGVGPEYVKGMREAGYAGLTLEALINARDHGVTPEYVRALGDGGYRGLPLDQVVRTRDHGITPDYISGMRQLGYTLSIEDLVRARDHGVEHAVRPRHGRTRVCACADRAPDHGSRSRRDARVHEGAEGARLRQPDARRSRGAARSRRHAGSRPLSERPRRLAPADRHAPIARRRRRPAVVARACDDLRDGEQEAGPGIRGRSGREDDAGRGRCRIVPDQRAGRTEVAERLRGAGPAEGARLALPAQTEAWPQRACLDRAHLAAVAFGSTSVPVDAKASTNAPRSRAVAWAPPHGDARFRQ